MKGKREDILIMIRRVYDRIHEEDKKMIMSRKSNTLQEMITLRNNLAMSQKIEVINLNYPHVFLIELYADF